MLHDMEKGVENLGDERKVIIALAVKRATTTLVKELNAKPEQSHLYNEIVKEGDLNH